MKLGEKEFTLEFKYYQLKQVAQAMGLELHEVPQTITENGNVAYMAEFGVKCIFYGCSAFESEEEIAKLVTTGGILFEAGKVYLDAFNGFLGIKSEPSEGETEAH